MFLVQSGYGAVHLSGWNLTYPTDTERLLWCISTVTTMICICATWCVDFVIFQMGIATVGIPDGMDKAVELNIHPHCLQPLRKGTISSRSLKIT